MIFVFVCFVLDFACLFGFWVVFCVVDSMVRSNCGVCTWCGFGIICEFTGFGAFCRFLGFVDFLGFVVFGCWYFVSLLYLSLLGFVVFDLLSATFAFRVLWLNADSCVFVCWCVRARRFWWIL